MPVTRQWGARTGAAVAAGTETASVIFTSGSLSDISSPHVTRPGPAFSTDRHARPATGESPPDPQTANATRKAETNRRLCMRHDSHGARRRKRRPCAWVRNAEQQEQARLITRNDKLRRVRPPLVSGSQGMVA